MGDIRHIKEGDFIIERTIDLPEILNRGAIYVDIYLHHPMVEVQMSAINCCTLYTMGYQKGFGSALNISEYGIIGLDDK